MVRFDSMNLSITRQPSLIQAQLKLTSSATNWFAGLFMNLPTDQETTIEIKLDAGGPKESPNSVVKWYQLHPVMTYADPNRYETYEWFNKDAQGRWVSGDTFKTGEQRYAGYGKIPVQHVLPPAITEQFLSADGRYWSAWREIDNVEAVVEKNVFRMKVKFTLPSAVVAIRMPYMPNYQSTFLEKLEQAHLPGVTVHHIGVSTHPAAVRGAA